MASVVTFNIMIFFNLSGIFLPFSNFFSKNLLFSSQFLELSFWMFLLLSLNSLKLNFETKFFLFSGFFTIKISFVTDHSTFIDFFLGREEGGRGNRSEENSYNFFSLFSFEISQRFPLLLEHKKMFVMFFIESWNVCWNVC